MIRHIFMSLGLLCAIIAHLIAIRHRLDGNIGECVFYYVCSGMLIAGIILLSLADLGKDE